MIAHWLRTRPARRPFRGISLGCLAALVLPAGCAYLEGEPVKPQFTPDGNRVINLRFSYYGTVTWLQHTDELAIVEWRTFGSTEPERSVELEIIDPGTEVRSPKEKVHVVPSPDSTRVAVVTPRSLYVVHLDTGEKQILNRSGERVTSLIWRDPATLLYAAHVLRGNGDRSRYDRTFWRQAVDDASNPREIIWHESNVVTGADYYMSWPLEAWSPDARFAIFASPYFEGRYRLLNVSARGVRPFGRTDGLSNSVSWKRDGTAALCVGGSWPTTATLVDPLKAMDIDLTEEFRAAFGDYPPTLEPLWTLDGAYVPVNDYRRLGCLVSPEPWTVLEPALVLNEHLDPKWRFAHGEIRATPLSSWVSVVGSDGCLYLTRFDGQEPFQLGCDQKFHRGDALAWSPDGTHLVRIRWPRVIEFYRTEYLMHPACRNPPEAGGSD